MSGADDVGLVQLLKNREDGIAGKNTSATKERKRGKYKSDEVESMDKVQMLGEAFQKIQAATGIHVLSPCLLYTSPSPRDRQKSRMPSSA